MTDFETHPAGTAARIAELESANGVHIFHALSKQEMIEVEKMAADGKYQDAAQKFGGQVSYRQDQRDLPPMTDAELALHLRGRLVPVSVAYRAASRIEQLVATVEQLEAALTRANAATAAAYEAAAQIADECADRWQAGRSHSEDTAAAIRALATFDQTAALDKLIAEAVDAALKQAAFWVEEAMVIVAPDGVPQRMALDSYRKQFSTLVLASKKGGAA